MTTIRVRERLNPGRKSEKCLGRQAVDLTAETAEDARLGGVDGVQAQPERFGDLGGRVAVEDLEPERLPGGGGELRLDEAAVQHKKGRKSARQDFRPFGDTAPE